MLVYAGNMDFICNTLGNQRWVDGMVWEGQLDFTSQAAQDWVLDSGAVAGQFRSAKGLTFLNVNDAGHMVPMDQPEAALDMLEIFTKARATPAFSGSFPFQPSAPRMSALVAGGTQR